MLIHCHTGHPDRVAATHYKASNLLNKSQFFGRTCAMEREGMRRRMDSGTKSSTKPLAQASHLPPPKKPVYHYCTGRRLMMSRAKRRLPPSQNAAVSSIGGGGGLIGTYFPFHSISRPLSRPVSMLQLFQLGENSIDVRFRGRNSLPSDGAVNQRQCPAATPEKSLVG